MIKALGDDPAVAEIVEQLRPLEERLRELAFEYLREAAEHGAKKAPPDQRRLEQARRAVARAIEALAPREEF